jgi:hypothetical protein
MKNVGSVVHVAGFVSNSLHERKRLFDANAAGAWNLLEFLREVPEIEHRSETVTRPPPEPRPHPESLEACLTIWPVRRRVTGPTSTTRPTVPERPDRSGLQAWAGGFERSSR